MTATGRMLRRGLIGSALGWVVAWALFPFWWAVVFSIKPEADFFGPKLLPFLQFRPTLAHWAYEWQVFFAPHGLGHRLANSLVVATAAAVLSLGLGLPAAVGLRERRRDGWPVLPLVAFVLLPRVVPPVIVALPFSLPFSLLAHAAGLSDTLPALAAAHATLALPWSVILLYTSLRELPPELLEAARLDGARWDRLLAQFVVPLLAPALVAAGPLAFALSWNEAIFALTNAQLHADTMPLSVLDLDTREGVLFGYMGSHLVLTMLPPLALVVAARRFVARGLSFGAVRD